MMALPTHQLLRSIQQYWSLALAVAALCYFSYHLVHGDRGMLAMEEMKAKLAETRHQHATQLAEVKALERKVELLKRGAADQDMVEEQLRLLGYVAEQDVIVLDRDDRAR